MKIICLLLLVLALFISCGNVDTRIYVSRSEMHGITVVDAEGNLYLLRHNVGDTYFIIKIPEIPEALKHE